MCVCMRVFPNGFNRSVYFGIFISYWFSFFQFSLMNKALVSSAKEAYASIGKLSQRSVSLMEMAT